MDIQGGGPALAQGSRVQLGSLHLWCGGALPLTELASATYQQNTEVTREMRTPNVVQSTVYQMRFLWQPDLRSPLE